MFLKTCRKLRTGWVKTNHGEMGAFKVRLPLSKKNNFICFNQSRLKIMKSNFYFMLKALFVLKDTHREKTPSNKTPAHEKYKYGHLGSWYIKSTLCKRFPN